MNGGKITRLDTGYSPEQQAARRAERERRALLTQVARVRKENARVLHQVGRVIEALLDLQGDIEGQAR